MRPQTLLLTTAALASTAATDVQQQLNYYTDSGCTDYLGQVDVEWASDMTTGQTNCYNYKFGGSMNIANCYKSFCMCQFFYAENCDGEYASVIAGLSGDMNCIRDSWNFWSFRCYFFEDY